MTPTKSTFIDAAKAGEIVGMSERQFRKRYVEKGLIRIIRFGTNTRRKSLRHIFLREDVEKLRAEER